VTGRRLGSDRGGQKCCEGRELRFPEGPLEHEELCAGVDLYSPTLKFSGQSGAGNCGAASDAGRDSKSQRRSIRSTRGVSGYRIDTRPIAQVEHRELNSLWERVRQFGILGARCLGAVTRRGDSVSVAEKRQPSGELGGQRKPALSGGLQEGLAAAQLEHIDGLGARLQQSIQLAEPP
jgi:hypothetical protein